MARVLLVNTNTMQPPVSPVGLDYVGSALEASGAEVRLLDLAFVERSHAEEELLGAVDRFSPDVIGLTIRNTDDCCLATRDFLLPPIARWIAAIKSHCDAPVVVGGVGFSVLPSESFAFLDADYGIAGDGEEAFPRLVECLQEGEEPDDIAGLLWMRSDRVVGFNAPVPADTVYWPLPSRRLVDNARYVREGAMVGIETKRGCTGPCIYCADPVAKGRCSRLRPPQTVVEEIRGLLDQGADIYHTCDSEFNLPADHGRAVCKAIWDAGLGKRIRWWAYCSPVPFDEPTAHLYRRAGCRGINFGCDSGSDEMLERLGRVHSRDDIAAAVRAAKAAGLSCMVDLLLGGPGETARTIRQTFRFVKALEVDRIGLSIGVRVYPGTALARALLDQSAVQAPERPFAETLPDLLQPYFWVEPALGDSIHDLVRELTADDPRFLFMDPARTDANYNYNDNSLLVRAIRAGHRGAFWDILRRVAENLPPA